jgi:hypothetical protein
VPSHNCPIAGCPKMVRDDHLMCAPHWRQVPLETQREVYASYRARNHEEVGSFERHHRAMEAAIAAVEGREPRDLFGEQDG